jgi:processive 1,2-diacylglycerol beta-glucosyltransferase
MTGTTNFKKKAFILYSTGDSGHYMAATSLAKSLKEQEPNIDIVLINALEFISPTLENFVHGLYIWFIKNFRKIYDRLWGNQTFYRKANPIKKILLAPTYRKFKKCYQIHKPCAVICTQVVPCAVFSAIKKKTKGAFKLYAVITDYDIHPFWIMDNIDGYFVATDEMKDKLISNNIPVDNVVAAGIPIDPKFSVAASVNMRQPISGCRFSVPRILLMAGSMGVGPLDVIASELDKLDVNFELQIVCGKNKRLKKKLDRLAPNFKHKIEVYGFSDDIVSLMSLSNLLITKPGGLTSSEALALGLPMIIYSSVGGQESRNLEYLQSHEVICRVNKIKDIRDAVNNFLNDKQYYQRIASNAKRISRPNAAIDIAESILNSI